MSKRVNTMCALALTASLASCAPGVLGSGGADVKVGHEMASVKRVYLEEVNAQTPPAAYVLLPNCSGGAVALNDVRRLGPQRAAEICNKRVAQLPVDTRGMVVMAGVLTTGFLLYFFVFRKQVDSFVKTNTAPAAP